jgi:hypothetical protein
MAKKTKEAGVLLPPTFTVNGKEYYLMVSGDSLWQGVNLVKVADVLANQEYLDQLVASESALVRLVDLEPETEA